jgi:CRP-like cAMP-binding protein
MKLLDALDEEDVRQLLAGATRRRSARREVLFHEGDPADALHLIDTGRVAVRITTARGDVATLDVVGPGEMVGELALLPPIGRRGATAVALEATETRMISAAAFSQLRAARPELNDFLFGILANRVRRLNERLIEALYVPVEARVARRLLSVAGQYARSDDPLVIVPLTQDDLAGLAGTTRESVNRLLRRLQLEGMLELRRGEISLLDQERLARLAR